ncbi:MAG: methylmalonyl-CoA mutase [Pyrinomonadaceae bacterium]|nr:methylmalonyl-CoA mutase [Sphingobacteriaceae bacterium]
MKIKTTSGIEIKEVYTEAAAINELPGEFPFTRGIRKDMYRGKLWTMRQYAGFSTAEESNKRYHYLLAQGTSGLSVAFDLPTQIGYDSDHPLSEGEVGKVGVSIDSLEDMESLFQGIDLEKITTSMTINATASILLAMYIVLARKQGADIQKISGTVQNDILKEYAARGTYIYPPKPSMRLVTDVFEYCSIELPRWNTISVSGYHIREAGSTAVQELAFTLANGKAYLEAAISRGLDINVFAKRISFFFNCHNNFFEEIAKFRAARRMWAKLAKEFGATEPQAQMLRFHTQTGGSTLTAQQPLNNIVRITTQALAAVLGGTQSLHTNGFDEAYSLPTENAAKLALRTQQIIASESGIAATVDPLAGSYFVESLTNELEAAAWKYIKNIDDRGGAVAAIEAGYIQNEISNSAYLYQSAVENDELKIVGVNCYTDTDELEPSVFQVSDSIRNQQINKLNLLKLKRDKHAVADALKKLQMACKGDENLMPYIIIAVEVYATLGEISDTLRAEFGEY